MTFAALLSILARRWWVVLLALAVAGGVVYGQYRSGGVYTSDTTVDFIAPQKTLVSFTPYEDTSGVVGFAGSVAQLLNNGREPQSFNSTNPPLYGAGVREGVRITQPNSGNQWVSSFTQAIIIVQVVGPSAEWVHDRRATLLQRIDALTDQTQASVDPDKRITANVQPLSGHVAYVGPSRLALLLAAGTLAVVALVLGAAAAVAADIALNRRSRRRAVRRTA